MNKGLASYLVSNLHFEFDSTSQTWVVILQRIHFGFKIFQEVCDVNIKVCSKTKALFVDLWHDSE